MRPLALTLLLLALPATAVAAGGPAAGQPAGGEGVTVPGAAFRYVAVPGGRGGTVVLRVRRDGGAVRDSRTLRGTWVVSAAAADGIGTGLSGDGRTLVLGPPRVSFPIRTSRFAVLDARSLTDRRPIALHGDFTLDAISPDGNLLYLVQYTSQRDVTKYVVRAYDVAKRQLRSRPVVDPAEADEPMRGMPLSRTQSPDGRWAYTLYDGAGSEPFVHALDTANATAKCIDLDDLAGRDDLWDMRLSTGPSGTVTVGKTDGPVLAIDPRTFAVRDAAERPAPVRESGAGDGFPLLPVGLAVVFAALGAAALVARRGRPRIGSA